MTSSTTPATLPADHFGLYIHIPFCVRKCHYCDFASQPLGGDASLSDRYLDALVAEAALRRAEFSRPVHSVFIGGGTPTTLTGAQLRRLWQEVIAPFPLTDDVEVSIEANPGTLSDDVLDGLRALPLTRVSLGMQSAQPDELTRLGRIHTQAQVEEAVAALRALGVPQLNLDLMYALPGQTPAHWRDTLDAALALAPDHLSLYALIVEDGTPLAASVAAGLLTLPSEDEEEEMARWTATALHAAGFQHYEVSNAARPGARCRHNLGYWLGRDYLGLGAAATSTIGAVRWRNQAAVTDYLAVQPAMAYIERLSAADHLLERIMLGLRLRDGFDLGAAEATCGRTLSSLAGETLAALMQEELLELADGTLRLTAHGYPLANYVVTRLMAASDAQAFREPCRGEKS
ncbi:MAG TPA: radical SAM family heme chaperone HemW [Armatimonadota bacterium]|jgi:oxygen-independent coproporphyrinogen-3 oxidase